MSTTDLFSPKQVAQMLGCSDQAIRDWSEIYAAYLSPMANPGHKKSRFYTDQDVKVFALVVDLKRRRMSDDEISATLSAGERGQSPDLTPGELTELQGHEIQKRLSLQIEYLQRQLETVATENERLRPLIEENAALKREVEILKSQGGTDEIRRLERLIGRLEYEIETLRKGQKGE